MVDVTKGTKAPLMPLMGSVLIAGTVLAPRTEATSQKIVWIPRTSSWTLGLTGTLKTFSEGRLLAVVSEMIPSVLASVSKKSSGFLTSAELPSALRSLIRSPEDGPVKA